MAGFYAVYHGQEGIKNIAKRIHSITTWLNKALTRLGYVQHNELFFDTLLQSARPCFGSEVVPSH